MDLSAHKVDPEFSAIQYSPEWKYIKVEGNVYRRQNPKLNQTKFIQVGGKDFLVITYQVGFYLIEHGSIRGEFIGHATKNFQDIEVPTKEELKLAKALFGEVQ